MTNYILPSDMKAVFAGHESFPLRKLWLPKLVHYIYDNTELVFDERWPKSVGIRKPDFSGQASMEKLGMGKNMVSSLRFWGTATQIINKDLEVTDFGRTILGGDRFLEEGLDEYCEYGATPWLMHWQLTSRPNRQTAFWYLFNLVDTPTFTRDEVCKGLIDFANANQIKVSENTLRGDVECCVRSYLPLMSGKGPDEEMMDSLFGELGLLKAGSGDAIEFHCDAHPSLPDALFAYALIKYWEGLDNSTSTLTFTRVAHDYGSPGRVFKLTESSIEERLQKLDAVTYGALTWTEQAGLRQVVKRSMNSTELYNLKMILLIKAYGEQDD